MADVTQEVLRVISHYETAVNQADSALWLSLWDLQDKDLTILENDKPHMLGRRYVEQLADMLKTARPGRHQTWYTNRVYLLGRDLAYTVSLRTEHNLPDAQKESRVTLLLRRRKEGWKIVHCHFSFVPQ